MGGEGDGKEEKGEEYILKSSSSTSVLVGQKATQKRWQNRGCSVRWVSGIRGSQGESLHNSEEAAWNNAKTRVWRLHAQVELGYNQSSTLQYVPAACP